MAAGIPLTDEDRWPWLRVVGEAASAVLGPGVVVACSALRRVYRDALRSECPEAVFVQLAGRRDMIAERMAAREHAYMPPALLESQLSVFEPLESDEPGFTVDITDSVDGIVTAIECKLEHDRDR